MKISLSGFLFENPDGTAELTFEEFANFAVETGYDAVQPRNSQIPLNTSETRLTRYRSLLDSLGLETSCVTFRRPPKNPRKRDRAFERSLRMAEILGADLIKLSGAPIDWIKRAAETAAERGVTLAVNNHVNTPAETLTGTLELFEKVASANFALLFDPMHLHLGGEDEVECLKTLYPFVRDVLVQCVREIENGNETVVSRAGKNYAKTTIDNAPVQDWPAILAELERRDYDGWITVIENSWPRNSRKNVAETTLRFIKSRTTLRSANQ